MLKKETVSCCVACFFVLFWFCFVVLVFYCDDCRVRRCGVLLSTDSILMPMCVSLSLSLSLKFLFSVLSGVVSQRYSICLSCEILDIWTFNRGAKDTGRKEEAKRRRQIISFGKLLENIINSNMKTNKKSNSPVSPHKNLKIVVSFFFFFFSFDR